MKMRTGPKGCIAAVLLGGVVPVVLPGATAGGPPRGSEFKVTAEVRPPEIFAVRFRHEMCPFCQAFDRELPGLIEEFADRFVLWVTLDLSDEASRRQAGLLAGALDIEHIWPGDLSKIGSVTLLNAERNEVLAFIEGADAEKVRRAVGRLSDR